MFCHRVRELGCSPTSLQQSSVEGCSQEEFIPWHFLPARWLETAPQTWRHTCWQLCAQKWGIQERVGEASVASAAHVAERRGKRMWTCGLSKDIRTEMVSQKKPRKILEVRCVGGGGGGRGEGVGLSPIEAM